MKQLSACFMVIALLCCGCSAGGSGLSESKDSAALPLAELDASIPAGFSDVPADAWYAEAAGWGLDNGFFDAGVFPPQMAMYRPMVAEALYRAAGSPAVVWVRGNGVVNGKAGNLFDPKGILIRAQTAVILHRYLAGGKDTGDAVVYMTTDISSDSLLSIYKALDWTPGKQVAVKLSTGEPGSNYLRTDLIGPLVQPLDHPAIVECSTAYGGSRSSTAMHYQAAEDHGYTAIADVDIMDENGSMTLPVTGGERLTENYVGANFADYDSFLVLSHFKGHAMAGFGGAIKNISIGIASAEGKCWIHSGGTSRTNAWGGQQDVFL